MDPVTIKAAAPIVMPEQAGAGAAHSGSGQAGFLDSLKDAIEKVNEVQLQANEASEKLMTGESQNVHQTMVALQRADVSFQLMMQVRNKIVTAYEEIQRMQV
jgi:flagellar hook-basal body complex protein FliE